MKPNLKLATERDPARAELAAAIEAATVAERAAASARNAATRAGEMVEQAQQQLEAASAAVTSARELQADRLADAAKTGNAPAPDRSMREARAREVDATDELDAARAALATCETGARRDEDAHQRANRAVGAAADAVIRSSGTIGRLLKETAALQVQLGEKRRTLLFLFHGSLVSEEDWCNVNSFLAPPNFPAISQKLGFSTSLNADWPHAPPSWRAAREALLRDPDAALPS
jgi:hypothetical protein